MATIPNATQNAMTSDELDAEILSPTGATNGGKTFFSLNNDNPQANIRFLAWPKSGNTLLEHYRFGKTNSDGVQMPCLTQFGRDCPYCALGEAELTKRGITMRKTFLYPVYWQEQGCQALFSYTVTGWSPLPAIYQVIKARAAKNIPFDAYDFTLTRTAVPGKGSKKTMYRTTPMHGDPESMTPAMASITVWTVDELREKYLETMTAFARKRQESVVVDANTTLDDDLNDIVL